MDILGPTVFLFVMAALFAIFEIEAEGKYGWAEKFPTWYRVNGPAKWYVRITHKPLTGYHLALFCVTLMLFFWPMTATSSWSLSGVLASLANYLAWVVVWDYSWFILNPHYGARRFRRHTVWWFGKEPWLGPIPVSYIASWVAALGLSALGGVVSGNAEQAVKSQLWQFGWYAVGILSLIIMGAPMFGRYYYAMRNKDERSEAGIFH